MAHAARDDQQDRNLGPTDPDIELVRRVGAGDRLAAAELIARHSRKVYALCFRMLHSKEAAEDAVQETFLRVWRNAARWRPQGAKFETWLYRVASNICIDVIRKHKRENPDAEVPEIVDNSARPDDDYFAGEKRKRIAAALEELPPRQRLAITLCHFEELSNIEAAATMEISVDAMESLLARGRRRLRDLLAPEAGFLKGTMSDDAANA